MLGNNVHIDISARVAGIMVDIGIGLVRLFHVGDCVLLGEVRLLLFFRKIDEVQRKTVKVHIEEPAAQFCFFTGQDA